METAVFSLPSTVCVDGEKWALIEGIDFSMIHTKLCSPKKHHGQEWSAKKAWEAIDLYKKWLYLKLDDSNSGIVPTTLIDDVWHQHILDTKAYQNDCQKVFGYFLHHFPYFGMRGEDDFSNLSVAFEKTKKRFEEIWGEPMGTVMHASMCDGEGTGGEPTIDVNGNESEITGH